MKKRFIIVGLILGLFFGGLFAYHFIMKHIVSGFIKNYEAPPITVNAIEIHPIKWQPTYNTVGSTIATQGTNISPIISGVVSHVLFNSGDLVKKGQTLLILDIDVLTAQLNNAKATMSFNEVTYKRYKTLFHEGALSEQDMDQAKSNYQQAAATTAQYQALLNQKYIKAPFSGRVGIRQVSLGQYLNAGDVITNIQSLNPIYVNFEVPEQFLKTLAMGQIIHVNIDTFKDHVFSGKITAFDAQVADDTKSITVQATLSNTDSKNLILPGMQANISVLLSQNIEVIAVPQQAIAYSLYGNSVYLVKDGKDKKGHAIKIAQQVNITPGDQEGNEVEVKAGLKSGDVIVTDGQIKLKNNSPITVITETSQS